ncbi:hypothetical protein JKF63_03792 [Porcisia hertigi]|uniref:Uncharacterized protein n=1 Tax=Porcisia hertigi TaxID=2761500 RepID=A0A836LEZ3_9TRYP|nr:hypothetical protein JKF63_03792 [Porcisia hertigi]
MQVTSSTQQRRTFSRANGVDGTAVPRLVAAEERHRKNLQHIQYLKETLCSTVSGCATPLMSTTSSQRSSLPTNTLPVPSPSCFSCVAPSLNIPHSLGASPLQTNRATIPVPHRSICTSASSAALLESQEEVERLVRERNKLQRQCVEWASIFSEASCRPVESTGKGATLDSHSVLESGAWSSVHEAALAVAKQVTRYYPSLVRDSRIKLDSAAREVSVSQRASFKASTAFPDDELGAPHMESNSSPQLTTEELADTLYRLAEFLPLLASVSGASELAAASGLGLLQHIHILEEEKKNDCLAVLSITDHLTEVAAHLQREAAEKGEALRAMQETVDALMTEKSQWARRAQMSEEALAERYEHYKQQERVWEKEMMGLLEWKQKVETASVTPMAPPASIAEALWEGSGGASATATEVEQGQATQLLQELAAKETTLATLQEEHSSLQAAYAELQIHSRQAEAADHRRIAELESQLCPLEVELQTQARIIESTLHKVEDLSLAHRADMDTLVESHNAILAGKEAAYFKLEEAKARVEVELKERAAYAAQVGAELETAVGTLAATRSASDRPGSFSLVREGVSVENSPRVDSASPPRLNRLRESGGDEGDCNRHKAGFQVDEDGTPGKTERATDNDDEGVAESPMNPVDLRRLQQSLKRMSRERAALQRRLEHRGVALAEMESKLKSARRLVAQRDAQVQVLTTELETAKSASKLSSVEGRAVDENDAGGEEADAEPLLPLVDFSEIERCQGEGTLYPDPVDLSEWLLGHTEGSSMRFSTYAQRYLSESEQVRISLVGPLYHIGFTLLKMEGFVRQKDALYCFPRVWRRFFFQLQHVLEARLRGTVLSPEDSAKCFYALASSAGLFGDRSNPDRDPLTGYALIIAALSVCLQSTVTSTSTDDLWGWHCCQRILRHVSHYEDCDASRQVEGGIEVADSQALKDLFLALCAERPTEVSLPEENAAVEGTAASNGTASVPPSSSIRLTALFASDLLSDRLPIFHFALWAASLSNVLGNKVLPHEDRLVTGSVTESTRHSAVPRPCLALLQKHDVASLMLYVARHEYLLFGWAQEMMRAAAKADDSGPSVNGQGVSAASLSLASLGLSATWPARASAHHAPSCSASLFVSAPSPTEVESITQLLVFLSAKVLPALMLVSHCCPSLERQMRLINAFFRTHRLLTEKRAELLPTNLREVSVASESMQSVSLLLTEAQLRDLVNAAVYPTKDTTFSPERAVQVPVAEYGRLHHELLSLYKTNDTYHRYIEELLEAAEKA